MAQEGTWPTYGSGNSEFDQKMKEFAKSGNYQFMWQDVARLVGERIAESRAQKAAKKKKKKKKKKK